MTQWALPTFPPIQRQYEAVQGLNTHATTDPPNNTQMGEVTQPPEEGDRGLGKASLALGGSFLAGSFLRNKLENHQESPGQQGGLGKVAQSVAIAGAGAVGAKIIGLFGNKQQQQPAVQTVTHTQTHFYPFYVPGSQASPQPPQYNQYPPGDSNYSHTPTGVSSFASPHQTGDMPMSLQSPSTIVASPSQGGPPLHIYGAVFADVDVTNIVRSLVTRQQTLQIKGDTLVQQFGDPWPEVERKMFNVLYSYGDRPMELIAAE